MRKRHVLPQFAALLAAATLGSGCGVGGGSTPPAGSVPIMGQSALTRSQIVSFFNANEPADGPYLTVSINTLAGYFVSEGNAQNVRGDIAFAQSLVETHFFRYGNQVRWTQNNFSGLGACDSCTGGASFVKAQTGVRAQIQHLYAYADPRASRSGLAYPLVDPRFDRVSPRGKCPTWNQMGNGNWATLTTYASEVLTTYNRMRIYNGLPPV
jgi:Mannosyl-glycoprotein endo-beta-N-acetylglucosaminidase